MNTTHITLTGFSGSGKTQLALALKTTLYGGVLSSVYKIIASRFDQRLSALDYDFETFCRAVQVLIENRVRIEVRS